ncbi:MAG TPA: extracellular solute-binding protein [Jiangellaceae bacterium]|nr:extracellular solute-binding protein [Jiangellaceae bacterium]
MTTKRTGHWAIMATAVSLLAVACGGGDDGGEEDENADSITVWVIEDLPDRVAAIQDISAAFTEESGIDVDLVDVAEAQFDQLVTSSAAAGDLPDVVGALPLAGVQSMAVNELLDTEAPGEIVDELGEDTFAEAALRLTRDEDTQLAVPSDAWAQLLVYRKDLFDAAGLEAPTTFDAITAAAEALDSPEVAGITAATIPGDPFTQQSFEYFALGNGCELVDDDGTVTLDSSNCVETFDFYSNLARNFSVPGNQDVDSTRATYFAGQAAMLVWSSFILDEMAGLRNDALPTCPECRDNPAFLAENSGVVAGVQGPSGEESAAYGEIVSWVVTGDAATDAATQYISYLMSDGYEDWIAIAPEGKVPTRQGTADDAEQFITAWEELDAGVDTKAPLSEFYDSETLEAVRTSPETIQRWGFEQGEGALVGATLGELPVATALNELVSGTGTAEEAAQQAQAAVVEIQESLG